MTVPITGSVKDVTGVEDNDTPWSFASVIRFADDGSVITEKPREVRAVSGNLKVNLVPGYAIVTYGKQVWQVTVPETATTLKALIEAGVAFPPDTSQALLDAAVGKYVESNREQFKTRAVPITEGPNAGMAQWVDANDDPVGDPVPWDQVISTDIATTAAEAVVVDVVDADLASRSIGFVDEGSGTGHFTVGGVPVSGTLVPPAATWSGVAGRPDSVSRLPFDVKDEAVVGDGTTNDRAAVQAVVDANAGSRTIRFPRGRYRFGTTGASSGSNRIILPSGSHVVCDPGAVFEINQIDYQSGTSIFAAIGTDGTKQELTANTTAGSQTITLPTGQAATLVQGDVVGFESWSVDTQFDGEFTYQRELRRVMYVEGETITLDAPLEHVYTTAAGAVWWKMNPARDIVIEGARFEPGPGVTPGAVGQVSYAIRLEKTLNCRLENIEVHNSIGGVMLIDAVDTQVDGLVADRLLRQDSSLGSVGGGYGLTAAGCTTNLIVNRLFGRECRHVFTTLGDARTFTGTAQAGGSTTITLASGAAAVDSAYVGSTVSITSGTGSGQSRIITGYVGSSKVATVAAWTTPPDATSVYSISAMWGGPQFVQINGAIGFGGSNGGTAIFDTHKEGRHVEFNNCLAVGGSPTRNTNGYKQAGWQIRNKFTALNNCRAYYCGRQGVTFVYSSKYGHVNGGEFAYNNDVGVALDGEGHTVTGVVSHHNAGYGVRAVNSTCVDPLVTACQLYENSTYGAGFSAGVVRPVVQGCHIPKGAIQVGSVNAASTTIVLKDLYLPGYGTSTAPQLNGIANLAGGKYAGIQTDSYIISNVPLGAHPLANAVLTRPRLPSGSSIDDANGARVIEVPSAVTSAVNWLRINNAVTTSSPSIEARGSDTNVGINVVLKGTGTFRVANNPVGVKVAVPASATATGVPGQWAADANYVYYCTATDTWRRAAIASW